VDSGQFRPRTHDLTDENRAPTRIRQTSRNAKLSLAHSVWPAQFIFDIRIQIGLHYVNISSGLQKPEIGGLGRIASLKSKTRRATVSARNPQVLGSDPSPLPKERRRPLGSVVLFGPVHVGSEDST
jgi:hypothetical protein